MLTFGTTRQRTNQRNKQDDSSEKVTYLQVDDGSKLAEMFIEFADVIEFGGNLPNQQLCVRGVEGTSSVVAQMVGFDIVRSEEGKRMNGLTFVSPAKE